MGLDQYLKKSPKSVKIEEVGEDDWYNACQELAYWRKVNAIHGYFIDHCAAGVDDCKPVKVEREALVELLSRCRIVTDDHSKAMELLPPRSGFFFGFRDLDQYYWEDLVEAVHTLQPIVSDADLWTTFDVYYLASW